MKYRHYAPTAPMLLVEGPEASLGLIRLAIMAEAHGLRTGVIALKATVDHFPKGGNFVIHNGGATLEAYAGTLSMTCAPLTAKAWISSWEKGCVRIRWGLPS